MIVFLKQILSGFGGEYSSKRTISLLAFLLVGTAFFANMFFNYTLDSDILAVLSNIIMVGMGVSTLEPLAHNIAKRKEVPE